MQVGTQPGEVIKPDTFKVIRDEGMPVHGSGYSKGNLYIQFTVSGSGWVGRWQGVGVSGLLAGSGYSKGNLYCQFTVSGRVGSWQGVTVQLVGGGR